MILQILPYLHSPLIEKLSWLVIEIPTFSTRGECARLEGWDVPARRTEMRYVTEVTLTDSSAASLSWKVCVGFKPTLTVYWLAVSGWAEEGGRGLSLDSGHWATFMEDFAKKSSWGQNWSYEKKKKASSKSQIYQLLASRRVATELHFLSAFYSLGVLRREQRAESLGF